MNSVNFLIKPASSLCNLRCKYCFYEDIACNRSEKSMGIMSRDTARQLIREAYSLATPGGCVNFAFQGGEPTLAGLDFFRFFTETAQKLRPKRVQVTYGIQTNGILLDEAWVAFLREHDFLVGLSLDGVREIHDRYRVDPAGTGTWERVRQALLLLQKKKVRVNVLSVVTGQCAKKPEKVYRELKKLGVRYIQFIACMDPIGQPRGQQSFSLLPEQYGNFLCRLFDLWYRDWQTGNYHSIRLFDDYVNILLGDSFGTCATCGRCGSYFVVEADGSVYPCDFFVLDSWKLGNLGEVSLREMASAALAEAFLLQGSRKPEQCLQCRWRPLCNGGCKNDWQWKNNRPGNYYCQAFQTFFAYVQPRLEHIARLEWTARQQTMTERGR